MQEIFQHSRGISIGQLTPVNKRQPRNTGRPVLFEGDSVKEEYRISRAQELKFVQTWRGPIYFNLQDAFDLSIALCKISNTKPIGAVVFHNNEDMKLPYAYYDVTGIGGFMAGLTNHMIEESIHLPRWSHIIVIVHETSHHIHMAKFSSDNDVHGKNFVAIEQKLFDSILLTQ